MTPPDIKRLADRYPLSLAPAMRYIEFARPDSRKMPLEQVWVLLARKTV